MLCFALCDARAEPVESKGRLESVSRPDPNKTFNLSQSGVSAGRTFQTDSFQGKQFFLKDWFTPKTFTGRSFWGTRGASVKAFNLSKTGQNLEAQHQVPNLGKQADTKTAETKEAPGMDKIMATKATADASRPYLGPEHKNMDRSIDPNKPLPPAVQAGHVMTLEEVRELLNKNK